MEAAPRNRLSKGCFSGRGLNHDRAPEVLSVNALEETILATPSIANGAIFLRSDQHLWCIGK